MIILDSHIGYGLPHKQDSAEAHGEPLGEEEVRLTKRAYGWPENETFLVPENVYQRFAEGVGKRGSEARQSWTRLFDRYRAEYPDLANEVGLMQRRGLPERWDRNLPVFSPDSKGVAGRDASGKVLNVLAQNIPWFLGGSADLGPSNRTTLTFQGAGDLHRDNPGGKILHFGIREHAMAAIMNGLSLSKIRPFGGTFLIFSDYARPAIRLAAIMELPVIFIFTHDAMGDGEDGPTHQPVEHLTSLRAMPGLVTLRPGDANEVVEAYRFIMQLRHQPAVLALSRQPLPTLDRTMYAPAAGLAHGAYVLADPPGGNPEVIIIASGSELSLAVDAHETLIGEGIRSRVVSMPSWELFDHESKEYRDSVLPPCVTARVAVEQASTLGWERYVGISGRVIGMHTFGASAPLKELQRKFGSYLVRSPQRPESSSVKLKRFTGLIAPRISEFRLSVIASAPPVCSSRAASRLTRLRMSHFDEVDRRKRAERQRGQWTADIKHTEVDREIAGLFDNSANLGLLISVVARVW
jgi:transketolase